MDAQSGLDQPDILIAGSKEALDASADTHTGFHQVVCWIPPNRERCRKKRRQELPLLQEGYDSSTTPIPGELKTIQKYYTSAVKPPDVTVASLN
jgi:hypothetical protein